MLVTLFTGQAAGCAPASLEITAEKDLHSLHSLCLYIYRVEKHIEEEESRNFEDAVNCSLKVRLHQKLIMVVNHWYVLANAQYSLRVIVIYWCLMLLFRLHGVIKWLETLQ